jgi:hypothetical protein
MLRNFGELIENLRACETYADNVIVSAICVSSSLINVKMI